MRRGRPRPPYDGKRTHTEIFEFWPSDLQQVFVQAGIPRRRPPQNADCRDAGRSRAIRRASRRAAREYVCDACEEYGETRIAFNATADASAHALYWFVNDAFVGRGVPGDALFWQPRTAAVIRCGWSTITGAAISPLAVGLEQ